MPTPRCGSQSLPTFPEYLSPWGRSLTEKIGAFWGKCTCISISIYLSVYICLLISIPISIYLSKYFFGQVSLARSSWAPSRSAGISCVYKNTPACGLRGVPCDFQPLIVHSTSSTCLICADSYSFIPMGQILKCPCTLGSAQRAPYFLTGPMVSSRPVPVVHTCAVAHGDGWWRRWKQGYPSGQSTSPPSGGHMHTLAGLAKTQHRALHLPVGHDSRGVW